MSPHTKNYVVIETVAFSIFFLLLFYLFSLIFQLTPARHEVGEYSIIWHTYRYKTVKNMPKNGLKIDEFKTHHTYQVPSFASFPDSSHRYPFPLAFCVIVRGQNC